MLRIILSLLLCLVTANLYSAEKPDKEKFHLYIAVGQSNMVGIGGVIDTKNAAMGDRMWVVSRAPSWGKNAQGKEAWTQIRPEDAAKVEIGPWYRFAIEMKRRNPEYEYGVIMVAVGGSSLNRWWKGRNCFDPAIDLVKRFKDDGRIMGIIWNQGEAGVREQRVSYLDGFQRMANDFRTELGLPDLPVVASTIAPGENRGRNKPFFERLDKIEHYGVADSIERTPYNSIHYDIRNYGILGRRQAAAMSALHGTPLPLSVPDRTFEVTSGLWFHTRLTEDGGDGLEPEWELTGNVPEGLGINKRVFLEGTVSGSPGRYEFQVGARQGKAAAQGTYTIVVTPPAANTVRVSPLRDATRGTAKERNAYHFDSDLLHISRKGNCHALFWFQLPETVKTIKKAVLRIHVDSIKYPAEVQALSMTSPGAYDAANPNRFTEEPTFAETAIQTVSVGKNDEWLEIDCTAPVRQALAKDRRFGLAIGLPPETKTWPVMLLHSRQSDRRPCLEIEK